MGKIIAISSGKGGTGKTTSVAAISSCLAALGYKTLCIDFNARPGNLDLALCLKRSRNVSISDVLSDQASATEACLHHPRIPNLYYMPAPSNFDCSPLFAKIRRDFDYCIIDSPSGIGADFMLAHADTDMSIIITTAELPAMRDANAAQLALCDLGVTDLRYIINRVTKKKLNQLRTMSSDIVKPIYDNLIGIIPEDKIIFRAMHDEIPLILYYKRNSAYHFLDAARKIAGEKIPWRLRLNLTPTASEPQSEPDTKHAAGLGQSPAAENNNLNWIKLTKKKQYTPTIKIKKK